MRRSLQEPSVPRQVWMNYQTAFILSSLFTLLFAAGSYAISYLYISNENSKALKTTYFFFFYSQFLLVGCKNIQCVYWSETDWDVRNLVNWSAFGVVWLGKREPGDLPVPDLCGVTGYFSVARHTCPVWLVLGWSERILFCCKAALLGCLAEKLLHLWGAVGVGKASG